MKTFKTVFDKLEELREQEYSIRLKIIDIAHTRRYSSEEELQNLFEQLKDIIIKQQGIQTNA